MLIQDFEKLGAFYLGALYDIAEGTRRPDLLLYDSKDLTTHAVCVGMTGSGKTGLCLSLLEEAAIDGIPAIAIDPKGDLGNLLLTFPELRPADFRPWVDPAEAQRHGHTPAGFAARTATLWQKGLADWGQDGARIARFRNAADLEAGFENETQQLKGQADPATLKLDAVEAAPKRMDITVTRVALAWAPWQVDATGIAEPAYD